MKVLVTGGNGFIGSRVVATLTSRGHVVRCLLRKSSRTDRIKGLQWEQSIGDVRDLSSLMKALQGCDAVIHAASLSSWADLNSPDLDSVVLGGTSNVLEAIRCQSVFPLLVYVGSGAALGGSLAPDQILDESAPFHLDPTLFRYAALKRQASELCVQAWSSDGVPAIIVHPAETYGPGDDGNVTASTLIDFAKGPFTFVCNGGTSIAHVDDVAEGIVLALEKGTPGMSYFLGGENLSIFDMAKTAHRVLGRHRPILTIPNPVFRSLLRIMKHLPGNWASENHTKYRYANHFWYYSNKRACDWLGAGFRSAEDTFRDTYAWLGIRQNKKFLKPNN